MKKHVVRSLSLTGVALAASVLLLAPTASADPGDLTLNINSTGVEFASDACPGAFGQVVPEGSPNDVDNYLIAFGGQGCTVRARFVGVDAQGAPVDTGYATNSTNDGTLEIGPAFRCYVEFGVQRANGTFYTRSVFPTTPETPNCPE